MDNMGGNSGFSFTPEQVKKVLGSKEGQKLLELLNRDGGTALKQAAGAFRSCDMDAVKRILEPVMQTPEASKLVDEINRK